MKYLACLFDFDYTLGDATEGIVASVNYALHRLNLPAAQREEIRKTVGLTLSETFEQLTGISDPAICTQYLGCFREKADEIMTVNTKLFPDTIRILRRKRCMSATAWLMQKPPPQPESILSRSLREPHSKRLFWTFHWNW